MRLSKDLILDAAAAAVAVVVIDADIVVVVVVVVVVFPEAELKMNRRKARLVLVLSNYHLPLCCRGAGDAPTLQEITLSNLKQRCGQSYKRIINNSSVVMTRNLLL